MIPYLMGWNEEEDGPVTQEAIAAAKAGVSADVPAMMPAMPSTPAPAPPTALVAVPAAGYEAALAAGVKKAQLSIAKCFVLALASGTHIAFGAFLALTIGGDVGAIKTSDPGAQKMIFGAFGLPFGLFMTVITGSELFTGNAALVPLAVLEGKASWAQLVKSLVVSWIGNLVGSLFLCWLVKMGGTLDTGCEDEACAAVSIATAKVGKDINHVLAKAVMCNWLVCMAVYMASFARDATGKFVAIWLPISAFVALGLEHTVANMFLIPIGMMYMADPPSVLDVFFTNLLPVTLGNMIGALIGVTLPFYIAFGSSSHCSKAVATKPPAPARKVAPMI